MSGQSIRVHATRRKLAGLISATLVLVGAAALTTSGPATGEESPQMPTSKVSLLQSGERTGLSARVHQMASGPALKDRGMDLTAARKFQVDGVTWTIVPAADGGACLVSPVDQIACVRSDAVADGRLMAITASSQDGAGVDVKEIVGVVPDGVRAVQVTDTSGQLLKEGAVKGNAYGLDITDLAKGPKKIQFVTERGDIVPLRTS